jgi:hypothetical protein
MKKIILHILGTQPFLLTFMVGITVTCLVNLGSAGNQNNLALASLLNLTSWYFLVLTGILMLQLVINALISVKYGHKTR